MPLSTTTATATAIFLFVFAILFGTTTFIKGAEAANAGGYFCRGCATLMEHVYTDTEEWIDRIKVGTTAGVTKSLNLDIAGKIVKPMCEKPFYKDYTEEIQDACKQITEKNAHVVSESFAGDNAASAENMYARIKQVCVDKMDLCEEKEGLYESFGQKKKRGGRIAVPRCDKCLAVVQNIKDILTRKKGSQGYLRPKHVWHVLENICTQILYHHPPHFHMELQEACENLLEEHDEDIADVFINIGLGEKNEPGKIICGKSMNAACSKRMGDWGGVSSTFASLATLAKGEL